MRCVISNDSDTAHFYERVGLLRSLLASNHQASIFDIRGTSVFDAFDNIGEFDLLISQGYNLNNSFLQCIKERPNLKIYLKVGDDGDYCKFYSDKHQILRASEEEKNNVRAILEMGNEVIVGCHYIDERLHTTHNNWEKMGCKLLSMPMAADVFDYCNGVERPEFKSDLTIISGYWQYKSIRLQEYLFPLFNPKYNYNIKIFGNSVWPTQYYLGGIETNLVKDALKSATICPHIGEPHQSDLGMEVSERPFKLLSNKCFCISEWGEDLAKVFSKEEVAFAKNPEQFKSLCDHFLTHQHERIPFIDRGYKTVMEKHTYFNRIFSLFKAFSIDDSSVLEGHEKVKKELKL